MEEEYIKKHLLGMECLKQGVYTLAYAVDHIQPVTGADDPLFWQSSTSLLLLLLTKNRERIRSQQDQKKLPLGNS